MNIIEQRKRMRGQGGFTLIELLVVIAILAVLGGAAILGIGQMRSNARTEVCETNQETIQLAVEAYRLQNNNAVPADVAALVGAGLLKAAPGTGTYAISGAGDVSIASCN